MRAVIRRKLAMAKRVLDYSLANPATDPGHLALVTRLQELIKRGEALSIAQQDGFRVQQAAVDRRLQLRAEIADNIRHLRAVATRLSGKDVQLTEQFAFPEARGPNATFLTGAKRLLQRIGEQKELFVSNGLGAEGVDALGKLIGEYDQLIETGHDGLRGHTGASSGLLELTAEVMLVVGVLDGLNRSRFKDDAVLLGAWKSARNVAGPFTVHDEEEEATTPPAAETKPDKPAAAA